jgi:hypothetical protein
MSLKNVEVIVPVFGGHCCCFVVVLNPCSNVVVAVVVGDVFEL